MLEVDLRESTHRLFDECADDYMKGDRHWGCDLDIITRCANQWGEVAVVELGSGYCWHLANLLLRTTSRVGRAVGVDYSKGMIERARAYLESVKDCGDSLVKRIELIEANILETPLVSGAFQVVLLMNNTLGNLAGRTFAEAKREREKALGEARRLLADDGFLVLTVYHAPQMKRDSAYGDVFELDSEMSDFSGHNFVVRYARTATPCFSHWFDDSEARALLADCGFEATAVEARLERLVFVCKKKD